MKINKRKPIPSIVRQNRSVHDEDLVRNMKFSFQYFDSSQKFASSYRDWQNSGLLSFAMETFTGMSKSPLLSQIDGDKFTIYGSFPPYDKTKFDFPKHIPDDANWARIHINGRAVVIGHVVNDTFYVVFLDKSHKFYLTKRETGK